MKDDTQELTLFDNYDFIEKSGQVNFGKIRFKP